MLCSKLYTETCPPTCPYAHSLMEVDHPHDAFVTFERKEPYRERFGVILRRGQVALLMKSQTLNTEWNDNTEPKWTFPKGRFNPKLDRKPVDTAARVFAQKTCLPIKREWLSYGYTVKEKTTHHTFFFLDMSRYTAEQLCSLSPMNEEIESEYRWVTSLEDEPPSHGLSVEGHKLCYSVQRFMGRKYDIKTKVVERKHAILLPLQ
jgi:NUDIX domain